MKIQRTVKFKRDYKRELKGRYKVTLQKILAETVQTLANGETLPEKYHDHALTGNWKGFRDCHIKPDRGRS